MIDNPVTVKPVECRKHGTYTSRQYTIDGEFSVCPICRDEADTKQRALDNQQLISENKVKQVNRIFENSCIPPRFKTCSFESYNITNDSQKGIVDELRQYSNDFIPENSPNLICIGSVGTGKTRLANAVANQLITRGFTAVYSTLTGIMDKLYLAGYERSIEIDKYIQPDFLIIDEIFAKQPDNTIMNLFHIIDTRYQNLKPTCLISNVSVEQLDTTLGPRISDRVLSNALLLQFSWESYRIQDVKIFPHIKN